MVLSWPRSVAVARARQLNTCRHGHATFIFVLGTSRDEMVAGMEASTITKLLHSKTAQLAEASQDANQIRSL